ncbi:YigZ family protein [Haloquadratum walsbyi]|jgi:Uncharacterized conserved protein|uniref:Impact N-terminal domain-containing protein n=1 Tax=Haloquadratum walsbyi J07HQW2 TaxID=1238425 RepID=U1PQC8_9EURY|nr:YigZ family protein [Haloquadratum walsbyi]ERG95957.1 MAG: hypothetical protein J07HQW2_02418 [Haloquadratum walsbyi J07HQW2]
MTESSSSPTNDGTQSFRTVQNRGNTSFSTRGSEFIGVIAPVKTVTEAERFINTVREQYTDATHVVPAYRVPVTTDTTTENVNPESTTNSFLREYQSDDGEPTGSAGKPALNVLVQEDIQNVVATVIRYYGDTNLGVGGLARAYSRAVTDAIGEASVIEMKPHEDVTVTVEYDDSGTVRGILRSANVDFEASYEAAVTFNIYVSVSKTAELCDQIQSATSGRATID